MFGMARMATRVSLSSEIDPWKGSCVKRGGFVETAYRYWYTQGFSNYSQNVCLRCLVCLRQNAGRDQAMKQSCHPAPDAPFDHLMMDFTELSPCEGKKYCLVIVDIFSKWTEVFPTGQADAAAVAKVLLREIIPRWGIPRKLTCDNGTHFVNNAIKQMSDYLGIDVRTHCAYHTQRGRAVERENSTIKNKLNKVCEDTGLNWVKALPLALMSMRGQGKP